jgi:thioester reductase-like protein
MHLSGTAPVEPSVLRGLVAEVLGVSPDVLERHVPLSYYGLDSLGAVELTARIGDAAGQSVPEWLDPGDATLEGLERILEHGATQAALAHPARLRADAVLASAIRPGRWTPVAADRERILLTGATGFVGAHLVAELLARPSAQILCLVRASTAEEGRARVQRALEQYGLPDGTRDARLEIVRGDLAAPQLGLGPMEWQHLATSVDRIHHVGALVNWVAPYEALRSVNVEGTRALLALACAGPAKPLHFVSSLAVCYAVGGPARVSESDDMLPYAADLPLGYAQTKCVAEALVRCAGERGLPVTIVRPALVSGARRSGVSNADDLLSALLKGCIQLRAAPDLDWAVDCVPADAVADAAVRLASAATPGSPRVFHLSSPTFARRRRRAWLGSASSSLKRSSRHT